MKRLLSALLAMCLVLAAALSFTSCDRNIIAGTAKDSTVVSAVKIDVDITEATFKGWIKELESSPSDYLGKTIRLEGVMYKYQADNGSTYNTVYRDGCCSGDHMYYLEFIPAGKLTAANDDWVEVVGTFSNYYEDEMEYFTLKDATVTVKAERGTVQLGL